MDFYEWVIVRSITINEATHEVIGDISKRGVGKEVTWYAIEENSNHKLKHNISSKITKEWSTDPSVNLLTKYNKLVLDKILEREDCIVGKYDILKNDGAILYDQIPHRDYPPRFN